MAVHRVPAGFMSDGLVAMTDADYSNNVDTSPSISEAYQLLARIKNPTAAACKYASVFGIRSRIGGLPRGEAPADGGSWRKRD